MKSAAFNILLAIVIGVFAVSALTATKRPGNIAFAEPVGLRAQELQVSGPPVQDAPGVPDEANLKAPYDEDLSVQAVLSAQRNAVISGTIDGVLERLPFENGDRFKKGDVLASYDCRQEDGRIAEIEARVRASTRQIEAFDRLKQLGAVADVEYVSISEQNKQDKALLQQARARAALCIIKAPFDGRVKDKAASNYEAVRSGRVLMEISSDEPLQAELLIPSVWLRWVNIGTPLKIYITESDKTYAAKITRIHGQVDPVTQTAHVIARIDDYSEELLPGMSGRASFEAVSSEKPAGFLGLSIGGQK